MPNLLRRKEKSYAKSAGAKGAGMAKKRKVVKKRPEEPKKRPKEPVEREKVVPRKRKKRRGKVVPRKA